MADRINRHHTRPPQVRHMEWVENDESPWGHWSFRHTPQDSVQERARQNIPDSREQQNLPWPRLIDNAEADVSSQ